MKSLQKTITVLGAALVLTATSNAASIVWKALIDNGLALEGGNAMLPAGDLLRIGVFSASMTDALINQNLMANNYAAVDAAFTQLGSTVVGQGAGANPGYFTINSTTPTPIDNLPGDLNIAGKQLYILAFNSATANTASQYGVFYFAVGQNSAWGVPSDDPTPSSTTVELSDLTSPDSETLASTAAGAHIVFGGFSTNHVAGSVRGKANFTLQSTPEPSSAMLLGAGALGLLARRRRNS